LLVILLILRKPSSNYLKNVLPVGLTENQKVDLPLAGANVLQTSLFSGEVSSDPEFQMPDQKTDARSVYNCMDELSAFFNQSRQESLYKEELLGGIKEILRRHSALRDSSFKESLSNVIVNEAERLCSIHLSAGDMVRVW